MEVIAIIYLYLVIGMAGVVPVSALFNDINGGISWFVLWPVVALGSVYSIARNGIYEFLH